MGYYEKICERNQYLYTKLEDLTNQMLALDEQKKAIKAQLTVNLDRLEDYFIVMGKSVRPAARPYMVPAEKEEIVIREFYEKYEDYENIAASAGLSIDEVKRVITKHITQKNSEVA